MPLIALVTDKNTHKSGDLLVPPQSKWTINGLLVATVDTVALADEAGHISPSTNSSTGSSKWSVAGKALHRHDDDRYCGAKTVVTSQTTFTVG